MIVFCKVKLRLYMVQSLKDKRSIIKSLQEKLQQKYNIAISELENNDNLKKSVLGIVSIANDNIYLEKITNQIIGFIDDIPEVEIINYDVEYI